MLRLLLDAGADPEQTLEPEMRDRLATWMPARWVAVGSLL